MSDWKIGAAARRDARHTKGPDEPAPHPAKKDKKRWCGGHVGREHTPVCMPAKLTFAFKRARDLVCTTCGKILEQYWGMGKQQPPPWVTE